MQADKGLPCNSGSNWGPANHTDQQHVVGIRSIIYTNIHSPVPLEKPLSVAEPISNVQEHL